VPAAFEKHRPRYRPAPRPSASERGYDARWQRESKEFLKANRWCRPCALKGRRTPATCVDHVIAHKGDKTKFWDKSNWQPSCGPCNSSKNARLEGGFGRESLRKRR
jgi:5-methylcytosine-specific restriction protein A